MPRVPDYVLSSVVYLGYDDPFKFGGTAFVVDYPIEGWDQTAEEPQHLHTWNGIPHQTYLVTARHILDGIKDREMFDDVRVRINSRSGGFVEPYPEFPISHWTRLASDPATGHFRDVAVIPFDPSPDYDIEPVAITRAALPNRIEHAGIGIGNELFYPGLFVRKPGENRNLPVLRVGVLAGMAEDNEPVIVDWYGTKHEIVAHLMESRSLQGLSGSPVFVHWPGIREEPGSTEGWNITSLVPQSEFYLLGLVSGHWDDKEATPSGITEKVNVGIGYTTPVDDIVKALDLPEHREYRQQLEKEWTLEREQKQTPPLA